MPAAAPVVVSAFVAAPERLATAARPLLRGILVAVARRLAAGKDAAALAREKSHRALVHALLLLLLLVRPRMRDGSLVERAPA